MRAPFPPGRNAHTKESPDPTTEAVRLKTVKEEALGAREHGLASLCIFAFLSFIVFLRLRSPSPFLLLLINEEWTSLGSKTQFARGVPDPLLTIVPVLFSSVLWQFSSPEGKTLREKWMLNWFFFSLQPGEPTLTAFGGTESQH